MAQDDPAEQAHIGVPAPPFTRKQYNQSPDLMKLTNDWLHKVYQHLAEKEKQLRLAEQERDRFKEEYHILREVERTLRERLQVLEEKDGQLQLITHELSYLKKRSFEASVVQHILSVLTAISFGVGINYVTSTPQNGAGWPLICVGVAIQSTSFFITYRDARKSS